ncbi:uncharacterized protein BJ171DRAFT_268054 [Polychytrium aggregatum]|uniref:uncharacterized protein n=1 Tax=Polychytrium aggregatum TaxID=110093 RepID=UPI0022FE8490|nr:uncharacterized protein BJ171DRAFT_268054 [Polychytrium aggregatum]KAI9193367.1 hypothetical protein BJ171DRAFT_268054 [Polychytrium aggregatum]
MGNSCTKKNREIVPIDDIPKQSSGPPPGKPPPLDTSPPIPETSFVLFQKTVTGSLVLANGALEIIQSLPEHVQVEVVSVVGKCRTGKSLLANRLLGMNQGNAFAVGDAMDPAAETSVIGCFRKSQDGGAVCLVVDVEGLYDASLDLINYDILALTLMISTVVVWNCFRGCIDNKCFLELSSTKRALEAQNIAPPRGTCSRIFWVVRDCHLSLIQPAQSYDLYFDQMLSLLRGAYNGDFTFAELPVPSPESTREYVNSANDFKPQHQPLDSHFEFRLTSVAKSIVEAAVAQRGYTKKDLLHTLQSVGPVLRECAYEFHLLYKLHLEDVTAGLLSEFATRVEEYFDSQAHIRARLLSRLDPLYPSPSIDIDFGPVPAYDSCTSPLKVEVPMAENKLKRFLDFVYTQGFGGEKDAAANKFKV